jgi:hypothetical protein
LQVGSKRSALPVEVAIAQADTHIGEGGTLAIPAAAALDNIVERSVPIDVDLSRYTFRIGLEPDLFHLRVHE